MSRYVRVAALSQVPVGGRWLVFVDGKGIVLFNLAGEVYALEDSCPHQGASLFSGKLEGPVVQCRAHGMRFDVRTGQMANGAGLCVKSYPVAIADGEIRLELDS